MNLFIPFLILFVLEILTISAVADAIGGFLTLLMLILAGIGGFALIKRQGTETIATVRGSLHDGGFPPNEVFERFCLVIAGLLFMVPGFLTDIVALVLLVPRARTLLQTKMGPPSTRMPIEGEFETIEPERKNLP